MEFHGLIIGVFTFLLIGLFHPIVIKCEYYFSAKVWPVFLAAGLLLLGFSLLLNDVVFSAAAAITGITCLWSIGELREQTRRVKRGWYPENPKRNYNNRAKKEN